MDEPDDMDLEGFMDDLRNTPLYPHEPTPQPPVKGIPALFLRPDLPAIDDGQIAAYWVLSHPDIAYGRGKWRTYTDGIWEPVDDEQIFRLVRRTCEEARRKRYRVNTARVRSVMELARNDVAVEESRWDTHPRLLPMRNGFLDMESRVLLPHQREAYATSRLDYDYDPGADCPNFRRVLEHVPEAAEFLQEFAGYCLTPETKLETAVWLYGPPGCGKSTFLDGLIAMLGARAGHLGLGDIDSNRFALARVPGKTLLTSSEQPENRIAVTHLLNAMISGELIQVEEKYMKAVEIRPIAKFLWAMNHLPRVMQADNGLMRRVKIVCFPALQAGKRDPDLKQKILAETAGILNWALEGLARLRERGGFAIPDAIVQSTKEFQSRNDLPKQFLEEVRARIDLQDPRCRTAGQYLYDQYADWCRRNGHQAVSNTRLAEEWRRMGFRRVRVQGHSVWEGVEVRPQAVMVRIPYDAQTDPD